jgi:hypothetical protein
MLRVDVAQGMLYVRPYAAVFVLCSELNTLHLHFAFARRTYTSRLRVAFAVRVRVSLLHFAFARRAYASRVHVAFGFWRVCILSRGRLVALALYHVCPLAVESCNFALRLHFMLVLCALFCRSHASSSLFDKHAVRFASARVVRCTRSSGLSGFVAPPSESAVTLRKE